MEKKKNKNARTAVVEAGTGQQTAQLLYSLVMIIIKKYFR
jgi:hypothetical protein